MTGGPHLDDGALLALIDGALAPGERAAAERHVAECADCRATWAELEGVAAHVGRVLAAGDPPAVVPPFVPVERTPVRSIDTARSRPRTRWRIAAAIAAAAALAVARDPLLALARGLWDRATGEVATVAAPAPVVRPAASRRELLRLVPDGHTLTVDLPSRSERTALAVARTAGDMIVLATADPTADVLVLPDQVVRVRNVSAEAAAFDLAVPAAVDSVVVTAGGAVVRRLDAPALARAVRVEVAP